VGRGGGVSPPGRRGTPRAVRCAPRPPGTARRDRRPAPARRHAYTGAAPRAPATVRRVALGASMPPLGGRARAPDSPPASTPRQRAAGGPRHSARRTMAIGGGCPVRGGGGPGGVAWGVARGVARGGRKKVKWGGSRFGCAINGSITGAVPQPHRKGCERVQRLLVRAPARRPRSVLRPGTRHTGASPDGRPHTQAAGGRRRPGVPRGARARTVRAPLLLPQRRRRRRRRRRVGRGAR
jgi:hypothetical protein